MAFPWSTPAARPVQWWLWLGSASGALDLVHWAPLASGRPLRRWLRRRQRAAACQTYGSPPHKSKDIRTKMMVLHLQLIYIALLRGCYCLCNLSRPWLLRRSGRRRSPESRTPESFRWPPSVAESVFTHSASRLGPHAPFQRESLNRAASVPSTAAPAM